MDHLKALVVDDKKIIGDLFGYILGRGGHDITVVQSGYDALERIKHENFDVAFLDIVMPKKDGIATLKELKNLRPEMPIVMMSGYSVEEKRQEVRALGAITCLSKPVEMDEVRKIIKSAIGKEI